MTQASKPHSRDDFAEIREVARVLEAMWPDDHRSAAYVKALDDKLTRIEEQLEALRKAVEMCEADEGFFVANYDDEVFACMPMWEWRGLTDTAELTTLESHEATDPDQHPRIALVAYPAKERP